MTAITRLTRTNDRHGYQIPPPRVRNPQLYVHPRSLREEQCGCGYPRNPCVVGKKWHDNEYAQGIEYMGNYCAVRDFDNPHVKINE